MPKAASETSPVNGSKAQALTERAWTSSPMEVTYDTGSLLPYVRYGDRR